MHAWPPPFTEQTESEFAVSSRFAFGPASSVSSQTVKQSNTLSWVCLYMGKPANFVYGLWPDWGSCCLLAMDHGGLTKMEPKHLRTCPAPHWRSGQLPQGHWPRRAVGHEFGCGLLLTGSGMCPRQSDRFVLLWPRFNLCYPKSIHSNPCQWIPQYSQFVLES